MTSFTDGVGLKLCPSLSRQLRLHVLRNQDCHTSFTHNALLDISNLIVQQKCETEKQPAKLFEFWFLKWIMWQQCCFRMALLRISVQLENNSFWDPSTSRMQIHPLHQAFREVLLMCQLTYVGGACLLAFTRSPVYIQGEWGGDIHDFHFQLLLSGPAFGERTPHTPARCLQQRPPTGSTRLAANNQACLIYPRQSVAGNLAPRASFDCCRCYINKDWLILAQTGFDWCMGASLTVCCHRTDISPLMR